MAAVSGSDYPPQNRVPVSLSVPKEAHPTLQQNKIVTEFLSDILLLVLAKATRRVKTSSPARYVERKQSVVQRTALLLVRSLF